MSRFYYKIISGTSLEPEVKIVYFDFYGFLSPNNPGVSNIITTGNLRIFTYNMNPHLWNEENLSASLPTNFLNYKVVEIGPNVFANMSGKYYLSIYYNFIQLIGKNAFQNTQLNDYILPSSIISIGNSAFENTGVSKMTIYSDSNLRTIGDYAFRNNKIKYLNIPKNVTSLGKEIVGPEILVVNFEGPKPSNLSNTTFNSGSNKIIAFYKSEYSSSWANTNISNLTLMIKSDYDATFLKRIKFTISDNVATITGRVEPNEPVTPPKSAFSKLAYNLARTLKINNILYDNDNNNTPVVVKQIGDSAFFNSRYTIIDLPTSIEKINSSAFRNSNLISIIFNTPSKLNSIGQFAFFQSTLPNITIPDSVTEILRNAFFNCTSLISVTINNTSQLKKIEDDVFSNTKISSLVIPASVTSLGVIKNIPTLKQITFNGAKPTMPSNIFSNLGTSVRIIYKAAFDSSWIGTSLPNAILVKQ